MLFSLYIFEPSKTFERDFSTRNSHKILSAASNKILEMEPMAKRVKSKEN